MEALALKARAERETLQVLNPFVDILRSPDEIKIPAETLSGALGHFVATLEGERLDSFVQDVATSPSLWKALSHTQVEAAVRAAPSAKVAELRPKVKDGWIFRNRLAKASRAWLESVVKSVTKSGMTTNAVVVLIGLLQGLDDVADIEWDKPRIELEEEIVIALAERFEKNNCDALDLFSAASDHIDPARLRALDLRQVVPRLNVELFTILGFPPVILSASNDPESTDMDHLALVSRGLARSFISLSEGSPQSQEYAWEELVSFVQRMHSDCLTKLQKDLGDFEPKQGSLEWERQKAALYAFTTVTWPGVEVMLNPHRHPSSEQSTRFSSLVVLTLAKFASLVQNERTMEGYEDLLYGCLDVLAAEGGTRATRSLFDELFREKQSTQLAAFVLLVAEQLVHLLDASTIRDNVMPLAARYFVRPEHRSAFQASNAFLLVLLEVASNSLERDSTQASFVDSMVRICANGLLKESRDGSVTTEQLLPAYTAVIRAAARYDIELVHYCIDLLDTITFDTKEYTQTLDMIRISAIPSIPEPEMQEYLDGISRIILNAPHGSDSRIELARQAFKVVMNEIPDESKQVGIEWWLKHRRVFQSQKDLQAKL